MYWLAIFLIAAVGRTTGGPPVPKQGLHIAENNLEPKGKIWALLAAGSNGFENYRHQADVLHAYQILHNNGIPDENIVVMMYDDIANNEDNPTPGIVINHPGGPNVYEGVPKDYTGKHVNPENFLNVLTGNTSAMNGIGSGKVIQSGPDDVVFVNFVDHGGAGMLYFPDDELLADKLIKTLSKMAAENKFAKLILYVEACHAGSMFDSLLSDNNNIFVLAAADPFESSYACYFDEKRQTYLGDVFSVVWMNDTEYESLPTESLHHQFERVRTMTNTSHVEEYGNLDVGATKLKDVIGFRMRAGYTEGYTARGKPPPPIMDVVDNMDVPLSLIQKKIEKETTREKKWQLKLQKQMIIKKRVAVDSIFNHLISRLSNSSYQRMDELRMSQHGLNWKNFPCYRELIETFNKHCLNIVKSPYVRVHLQKFINMCSVNWLVPPQMTGHLIEACNESSMFSRSLQVV